MKLLELEIFDTRGIKEISLKLDGKNTVICGQNGSGKSGIVDSLDFLLTGDISRLSGTGTQDISLSKHGPHISATAATARVKAKVKLTGDKIVTIERCMSNPRKIVCDPPDAADLLKPVLQVAAQRQHVLTRREILKYITAPASDRAQQIQQLLNITAIEDMRKTLVRLVSLSDEESKVAQRSLVVAKSNIASALGDTTFNPDKFLQEINSQRAVLGAPSIPTADARTIKKDIKPIATSPPENGINPDLIDSDFETIAKSRSDPVRQQLDGDDRVLRETLSLIRSSPKLLHDISHKPLIQLGIKLLDDSGICPLCDKEWPKGKLSEHLTDKLNSIEEAEHYKDLVTQRSTALVQIIQSGKTSLDNLRNAARQVNSRDIGTLNTWSKDLTDLLDALKEPLETYPVPRFGPDSIRQILAPQNIDSVFASLKAQIDAQFPRVSSQITSLEKLTRFEELAKSLAQAESALSTAKTISTRAETLLEAFYRSRDTTLTALFDSIAGRFSELYRKLHEHEGSFEAELKLDEAGLKLHVDFYDKGKHPPHALHSEGHQDSMGVGLYLTLTERLTKGVIDLLILDDVVMSVDALHRRQLCTVLKDYFPDRQFIITTHDWVWAYQLKTTGVVGKKQIIEFYDWDLELGPQVNYETDMWDRIDNDMARGDVSTAAARLRRGSEQFFAIICDNLKAPVIYKLDGRIELGNLIHGAKSQFQKLISDAIVAANSWSNTALKDAFVLRQKSFNETLNKFHQEHGSINYLVHYNDWANFTVADFKPIVAAYKELYQVFLCSKCSSAGGEIQAFTDNGDIVKVSCGCGEINWNLKQRHKAGSRISGFAKTDKYAPEGSTNTDD